MADNDFKDPSQMTDEELDAKIAGEEITEPPVSTDPPENNDPDPKDPPENNENDPKDPPEDPKDPMEDPDPKDPPAKDPEEDEDPADPQDPKDPVEEPKKPSRKELRIQDLIHKFKANTPPAPATPSEPVYKGMDYAEELNADPETIKKLEEDRQKYLEANAPAPQQVDPAVEVSKFNLFQTRLEIDGPKVASKFPQFDKENTEAFKPAAANAANQLFLTTVGYDPETNTVQNPDLRYADYIEGLMELAEELASVKVATTQKNIKKQAAQTSLRPDGSQAKRLNLNQAPETMTDEELDAYIAQTV